MDKESSSDELISYFWRVIEQKNDQKVPGAIARALLYWPVYMELLRRIDQAEDSTLKKISNLVAEAISATNSSKQDGSDNTLDWTRLFFILLAAALKDEDNIHRNLYLIYQQKNKDENGSRSFVNEGIGFYYRFAAAFQDWIVFHRLVPWYRNKALNAKKGTEICNKCKAQATKNGPTLDAMNIFYENVAKSRTAFRSIFGFCPKDIVDFCNEPTMIPTNSLSPHKDMLSDRLWAENIFMMKEVEDLAYIHSGVHRSQRIVDKALATSNDNKRFNELFQKLIYGDLHVQQLTLFVRSLETGHQDESFVSFYGTDGVESQLGITLPTNKSDIDKWDEKYSNFLQLINLLYKGGRLSKKFFKDIQSKETSPTDGERSFPFLLVPDGEVNFYYAQSIVAQKKRKLNIENHDWSRNENVNHFWKMEEWWNDLSIGDTGGVFPESENCHDRCSSLVGMATMSSESEERMKAWKQPLNLVKEFFCPFTEDGQPNGAFNSPVESFDKLLNDSSVGMHTLDEIIENARISFLPEILLRANDDKCHTLFFLPVAVGMKRREFISLPEKERWVLDDSIPLAMIAGTLHGIEQRWLPFNSYRIVSYLYPLARILQPIIDKMSHSLFLTGALEAEKGRVEARLHVEEENRRKTLENEFKKICLVIKDLNDITRKMALEIVPAALALTDGDLSKKLDDEIFGLQASECQVVINGKAVFYKPIHNIADLKNKGQVQSNIICLLAALSLKVGSEHDLRRYFFIFLESYVTTYPEKAITVFVLLKDIIHRARDSGKKYITPWQILVSLCLMAAKETVIGGTIRIFSHDDVLWEGQLQLNDTSPSTWELMLNKVTYARAQLHEQWYLGAGKLIEAVYNLVWSGLKPRSEPPGGIEDAFIIDIVVNVHKPSNEEEEKDLDGEFELILAGEGGFSSSFCLGGLGDDSYHNLRSPIMVISKAVGAPLTPISGVPPKNYTDEMRRVSPVFSLFQWKESGEFKFQIRILFGRS